MKKTLVFGASLKPDRYSNLAVRRLNSQGIETEAFGLVSGEIDGVEIKTSPNSFEDIHTVSLYMKPKRQREFYQDIIDLKPKRVIFNPGTENPELYQILKDWSKDFWSCSTGI